MSGRPRDLETLLHRAGRTAARAEDEAAVAAVARFAASAADEADVAYAFVDSPLGRLLVAGTRRGLNRVEYADEDGDALLDDIAATISPRILEAPARLDDIRRQLDEYFEGRRHAFDVTLDLRPAEGFRRRVLRATWRIPYGSVATYRDVATRAGNAAAVRAAGNAVGWNHIPIVIPCHRV
ncbi:MAG TPA: methylated-DNA--[protein]-cysteine S-methyltransferase, partial [Actinomycetota bacterium]|nr:methylated-DNA--[protein]-cysteine S-methyltransferase [Actinomycetota bacterium]